MAEAEEINEDDSDYEEARELERLLEGENDEGEEAKEGENDEESTPVKKGLLGLSKKKWIMAGGGIISVVLIAGGAYYYLSSSTQNPEGENQLENGVVESVPAGPQAETVKNSFEKVHIFTLKPFFLPLKAGKRDTGKFISVLPNLVLSNGTLSKEVENSLPTIRKNIYNILNRKSPREYFSNKRKIEEQIKIDIITSLNPVLLAGTGTITDVVFTQFVVK